MAIIVDEAHRLKNRESRLSQDLATFQRASTVRSSVASVATSRPMHNAIVGRQVLLSGTPIQNNLNELFSLISFAHPSAFPAARVEELGRVRASAMIVRKHTTGS